MHCAVHVPYVLAQGSCVTDPGKAQKDTPSHYVVQQLPSPPPPFEARHTHTYCTHISHGFEGGGVGSCWVGMLMRWSSRQRRIEGVVPMNFNGLKKNSSSKKKVLSLRPYILLRP